MRYSEEMYFTPENEASSEDDFLQPIENRLSCIRYRDGSRKIFKTARYPDSAHELRNERSIAAYRVDRLLDLGLIPETDCALHAFGDGQVEEGTVQTFIDGILLFQEELFEVSKSEIERFIRRLPLLFPSEVTGDRSSKGGRQKLREMIASKATGKHGLLPVDWELIVEAPLTQIVRASCCTRVQENGEFIDSLRALQLVNEGKIVPGTREAVASGNICFSHPDLQKGMAQAQMLDLLIGERDRHAHNFIYERRGGHFVPRLIDHERCFYTSAWGFDFRFDASTRLPRLIDATMAASLLSLSTRALHETLLSTGLPIGEIEMALQRLEFLKKYLASAGKEHAFVTEWNQETFERQLEFKDNYLQRERDVLLSRIISSRHCQEIILRNITGPEPLFPSLAAGELLRLFRGDQGAALWQSLQQRHAGLIEAAAGKVHGALITMDARELLEMFLSDHAEGGPFRELLMLHQPALLETLSKSMEALFLKKEADEVMALLSEDHAGRRLLGEMLMAHHPALWSILLERIEGNLMGKSVEELIRFLAADQADDKKVCNMLEAYRPALLATLREKAHHFFGNITGERVGIFLAADTANGCAVLRMLATEFPEAFRAMLASGMHHPSPGSRI